MPTLNELMKLMMMIKVMIILSLHSIIRTDVSDFYKDMSRTNQAGSMYHIRNS